MAGRTGYWQTSFKQADSFAERTRPGQRADSDAEAAGDPCSRDTHCAGRRVVVEGTTRKVVPARTYGSFCTACRMLISSCLAELPPAFERLAGETAEMHRRGTSGHSAFGPRLPFDPTYPDLMNRIAQTLLSYEERVRDAARLSALDTALSRRRDQLAAVRDAARLLGHADYFSALLALPPGPMVRSVPDRSRPDAIEITDLDGRDAGEEILALHRKALLVLGEIVKQREMLDGVPCKRCEEFGLQRAEPPSDPAKEAMWSECSLCRHPMSKRDFDAWAKWYGGWADRRGLECRRCLLGRHGECEYRGCACGAGRHGDVLDVA